MRLKMPRVELGGTSEMFRSRAKHTHPVIKNYEKTLD